MRNLILVAKTFLLLLILSDHAAAQDDYRGLQLTPDFLCVCVCGFTGQQGH